MVGAAQRAGVSKAQLAESIGQLARRHAGQRLSAGWSDVPRSFVGSPGHIASLMPRLMSQTFTGSAVAKPRHMPICMPNQ